MAENDQIPQDEEELRRQIRAEIEERDRQQQTQNRQRETTKSANEEAEKRRRIYQEELQRYYQDKPDFQKMVREDGEVDWVPEAEVRREAELFDEVLEDPEEARGRMKWILMVAAGVVLVFALLMYLVLHETTGAIQITSNVPHAQIVLDTNPLDRYTDDMIREVPAGEHVVTLALKGYRIQGDPVRRIHLKGGKTELMVFILVPDTSSIPPDPPHDATPEDLP